MRKQKLFKSIRMENIHFGNIKSAETISKNELNNLIKCFNGKRFVAASTHRGEDFFALKHIKFKKQYQDIVTIIAPRHIERSREIENIQKLELMFKF